VAAIILSSAFASSIAPLANSVLDRSEDLTRPCLRMRVVEILFSPSSPSLEHHGTSWLIPSSSLCLHFVYQECACFFNPGFSSCISVHDAVYQRRYNLYFYSASLESNLHVCFRCYSVLSNLSYSGTLMNSFQALCFSRFMTRG